ncbi:hypothetical protein RKD18_000697 [Streptomyces phaeoluteigriseus]
MVLGRGPARSPAPIDTAPARMPGAMTRVAPAGDTAAAGTPRTRSRAPAGHQPVTRSQKFLISGALPVLRVPSMTW